MGRSIKTSVNISPEVVAWINSFTDNQLTPRGTIQPGTRAASPNHVERNYLDVSTDNAYTGHQDHIPVVVFTFFPPITLRSLPRRISLLIPLGWWNVLDSQDIRKALHAEVKGYLEKQKFPNKLVMHYEHMVMTQRFLESIHPSQMDLHSPISSQARLLCNNGQITITIQAEQPFWRFNIFIAQAMKPRTIVINQRMMVPRPGESQAQTVLRVLREANAKNI